MLQRTFRASGIGSGRYTSVTREQAHARDVVHDEGSVEVGADRHATTPGIRASDEERAQVVAALNRAGGEGRLSLEEVDQRIADAYTARFREQLGPLTADLPVPAASGTATGWLAVWHGVLRQSRATLLGATPDARDVPTRRQHVLGALAVLAILVWLAVWVLIGFGVAVIG